jgi:hypothetical protein
MADNLQRDGRTDLRVAALTQGGVWSEEDQLLQGAVEGGLAIIQQKGEVAIVDRQ